MQVSGIFRPSSGQPAHQHATLCCDFSSNAVVRSTGQRTALTLMRLITGSGASSNSECTSRGCTTLTNWNSVCSKCGVTSTRASLTMQLASGASVLCMRAGERWTLGAYAVENNTPISSQPYDNINVSFLSNTTLFLILFLLKFAINLNY